MAGEGMGWVDGEEVGWGAEGAEGWAAWDGDLGVMMKAAEADWGRGAWGFQGMEVEDWAGVG